MNLKDAETMARELIAQYIPGWRFVYNDRKTAYGVCYHGKRQIQLSRPLTYRNDEAHVRNTLLHEIAHALTPGHGHDYTFKLKAREIGASYEHTKSSVAGATASDIAPYEWVCPQGHVRGVAHRLPNRNRKARSCGQCAPNVFDPTAILTIRRRQVRRVGA